MATLPPDVVARLADALARVLVADARPDERPAKDVDHIDGNSRNNAAENLRACCHACHSRRTAVDQGFARRVS